jgi:hypothetical protein
MIRHSHPRRRLTLTMITRLDRLVQLVSFYGRKPQTRQTVQRYGLSDGVAGHQLGVLYVTVFAVPSTLGPHKSSSPATNAQAAALFVRLL